MKIKNKKMNFKIMNHLRNTRKLFKKKKFLMLISKLINKISNIKLKTSVLDHPSILR